MTNAPSNETQAPARTKRRGNPNFVIGNPGGPGRPPKVWTEKELFEQQVRRDLKTAAKQFSPAALNFLVSVLNDENAATKDRMNAATQILDRAHGKATTHSEVKVDVYDRMTDKELLEAITGKTIDAKVVERERGALLTHNATATRDKEA